MPEEQSNQVNTILNEAANAVVSSGCVISLTLFFLMLGIVLWLAVFRRGGRNWHDIAFRAGRSRKKDRSDSS